MSPADGSVIDVDTPLGPGRFHVQPAVDPVATLVLGHGAGGGVQSMDLELLARQLPPRGVTVVRFEQPWRTAGRRVAARPAQLDVGWRAAVEQLRELPWVTGRLFFGGRSAGARVACRTATEFDVAGVVCLAFPLHLPGQPEKSRLAELLTPSAPRLVLQGGHDAFGGYAELVTALDRAVGVTVVELAGADHSFRTPKGGPLTPAELRATVVAEVAAFVAPQRRTTPLNPCSTADS
ncbi:MAG TPA: alpha/beta family hydrolase [Propionibacteriaceae bacterium]